MKRKQDENMRGESRHDELLWHLSPLSIRSKHVPLRVHSWTELQTHLLSVCSSIKSSSVPAALPAWGLHLVEH